MDRKEIKRLAFLLLRSPSLLSLLFPSFLHSPFTTLVDETFNHDARSHPSRSFFLGQ